MTEETKIKFPFEPNEKVKAAFRQEVAFKEAVRLMTEAILKVSTECVSIVPFKFLFKEHPELIDAPHLLIYNHVTEKIDLKKGDVK